MAVAEDTSVIDWLAGVQRGQESLHGLLAELHDDLHAIREYLTLRPEIWMDPVSAAHPLIIDRRGRDHLYALSPVALQVFYPDMPGQVGNPVQVTLAIPAGRFVELPFLTGDKLYCPAIAITSEVTLLLLAQNAVLLQ